VEDVPGVTRDRVSYEAEWNGRRFILIDTGGWDRKARGMGAQIAAQAERAINARIVVGEEIRTPAGEIIGLFLNERIPYVLPLDEVVGRIRAQGGVTYAPHPFDPIRNGMREHTLRRLHAEGQLDVIEIFNAKTAKDEFNQAAKAIADELGIPGAAGSDAHDPIDIGTAWVEMPDFDGPASFLEAIQHATVHGEYAPYPLRYPGANAHELYTPR
ncbi:MAG: hypothetical protein GX871_02080, partial [Microbacteriaceae bacterium]|nr:hypothetical protein [Microbacteriaceae bacterium]